MSVGVLTLVTHALTGLNVYAPDEALSAADGETTRAALQTILDDWTAERAAIVAELFTTWPLTPGLSPHTIGPTGTFVVASRPVSIDGAALVLSAGVYEPIFVTSDPAWWAMWSSPTVGGIPTSCYYEPSVPNGAIYFAGTPTAAGSVRLMTRTTFPTAIALTDSLDLAPGYQSALELTLMETIAETPFGRAVSADLAKRAGQARARSFRNNTVVPTLTTAQPGMPGARGGRWNYLTGTVQ